MEGVLAHELSHVAHRDVAVMTIASFLGVLAGIITRIGLWGGLRRAGGRDANTALLMVVIPLVSAVVYVISFLLTRLLSRYRSCRPTRAAALLRRGRPVGAWRRLYHQGHRGDSPDPLRWTSAASQSRSTPSGSPRLVQGDSAVGHALFVTRRCDHSGWTSSPGSTVQARAGVRARGSPGARERGRAGKTHEMPGRPVGGRWAGDGADNEGSARAAG
ncbi:hypothetical protein GCM10020221_13720 [Streptomyces thioluteus]|uniref:Peptidase M48 domain-containing protein n=1 Tax=Streptomyces thioluteus TaxID=66431 RepID=A0ABN3WLD5_STRTU